MDQREGCELCARESVLSENELAYVRPDNHALSRGHILVVPKRHVADFFEMTLREQDAVVELLREAKKLVHTEHSPGGYNIGVNVGQAAGQSRMHVHVHLIPRYLGDVPNPKGGVRCVLAGGRDVYDALERTVTTQPTADFFRQLELERTRALVSQDMKKCWTLHAPNYMLISPPGRALTRERYLGLIETGTLKYLRWDPEEIEVRVSPLMAIVRYQVTLELASRDGEPSTPFKCWHTDSFELNPEGWQAVWSQATRIAS